MNAKQVSKYVHEGDYVAEVIVTLIVTEEDWAPYLSVEDAKKLDTVRLALRAGDLSRAAEYGRVFKLLPVAA